MKKPDPLINAKLKSKAHLRNTFFDFVVPYLPGFASKFKKGKCDQNFFCKTLKKVSKTKNFTLISNLLKKYVKNAPKISCKQNKFDEHE